MAIIATRPRSSTAPTTRPTGAADADPAWDYLLALIYPLDQSPPALPTHRVIRGRPCGDDLLERLAPYAAIERLPDLETPCWRAWPSRSSSRPGATGTGRIGLFTARSRRPS